MSHFSTLRSKLTDAELLQVSLADLGLIVNTNADVRGACGQKVQADIMVTLEGDYDLGWVQNQQGTFDLIADLWGVAKKHNLANLVSTINQKYAINKTLVEVKQPGLQNAKVNLMVQQSVA